MHRVLLGLFGLAFGFSVLNTEPPASTKGAAGPELVVVDEAGDKHVLTAGDFAKLPVRQVEAKDHSGANAVYEGVVMEEVLRHFGLKLGKDLRGPALANTLLIEAADKYRVVFALPEIDSFWTDDVVLIAYRKDGKPLPETHGPYQLVVPHDKRRGRWVKQVLRLRILAPPQS